MKVCPRCNLKYPDTNDKCFVDGTPLQTAQDDKIGKVLSGRYLIEAQLGEGGMATVYRGRHTLVDRPVAIKILNPRFAKDKALLERFRREAKNAATLAHPNIIEIYDFGEAEDGSPFLVMELLDGMPLSAMIERGPIDPPTTAMLGLQIARGLARAHDFQVIHRDLKPDNIYVTRGRDDLGIKLLDFGIARSAHDSRLTGAGEIFGTPQYMAPERVTSIDAGPAADLYAVGVILFEMVTGRLPFEAQDITTFFIKHMQEKPPSPSQLAPQCPRRLEELILKLLAKKPEERPVDAHSVIKELTALVPADSKISISPTPAAGVARQVAPTLPPTTLERWAKRAVVFEEMLKRAFPVGAPPPELKGALGEVRGILGKIHELRGIGLKEQRKLDQIEQSARDGRQRLGFAVDTLATDLSQSREAARAAKLEVQPYFDADRQAQTVYRQAWARLQAMTGGREVERPTPEVVSVLRETADALDRWSLANSTADKARRWVEGKEREVVDLEYQVQALRGQLERLEGSMEQERTACEEMLRNNGKEVERLENSLLGLATKFCTPLRPRRELNDLFAELEAESA